MWRTRGVLQEQDGNLKCDHVISDLLVDQVADELGDCQADWLVIALEGPLKLRK